MRPALPADRGGRWRILPVAVAALALPACGFSVEDAVGAAAEQLTEEATGLEIEDGDGSVTVEGDDFSLQIGNGDSATDGSEDRFGYPSMAPEAEPGPAPFGAGGVAEIPEGFTVPFPSGGVIEAGSSFASGHIRLLNVGVRFPSSELDRLVAFYDDHFAGVDGLARHESMGGGGERSVMFVTNEGGLITGVTVTDQAAGALLFIETMVPAG